MEWKSLKNIVEYGEEHEISSDGQVRNIRHQRILKHWKVPKGYNHVKLLPKGAKKYAIHRLVALAFIPNPDNKPQVNHKDGNKMNNSVENLEWVYPIENIKHANENGLLKTKLTQNDVVKIKKLLSENKSQYQIAKQFNVSRTCIANIHTGKTWSFVEVDGFTPFAYDAKGEHSRLAKLNDEKVKEIRNLYATGNYSSRQLGTMFGVAHRTIQDIVKFKAWKHVD